ncbi:MAG: HNH endonuclease [Acidobacteriaceae bacterium]
MPRSSQIAAKLYRQQYYRDVLRPRRAASRPPISGICSYCGAHPATTVDHIIPVAHGGSDDPMNLRIACRWCNMSKGDRSLEEWRSTIARRVAGIPNFSVTQREWLIAHHGIDVYRVPAEALAEVRFAFECPAGSPSPTMREWRR